MEGKIYVVNVGSNASHNFCSPILADRTFEFIPIPEDRQLPGSHGLEYQQLNSFYDPQENLSKYMPETMATVTAHSDPEFDTFTYGDNCEVNPRAMSLRQVKRGDFLFFLSRMELCIGSQRTGNFGFYFIWLRF